VRQINMTQARSNLSRLVASVETGRESEIVIARHGRPVARLVPLATVSSKQRIGVAKGAFVMPESIDSDNEAIGKLFG
jgi:prevent-host-death family protein